MTQWIMAKRRLMLGLSTDYDYLTIVEDLLSHPAVAQMWNYVHHRYTSTMKHCLYVSYNSYLICRLLGLDARAAARGALLHDFYLYDWHQEKPYRGLHGFVHPAIALRNASDYFSLTQVEQDIIRKHMWPLTPMPPRYWESFVVMLVDKYCAVRERFSPGGRHSVRRLLALLPSQ